MEDKKIRLFALAKQIGIGVQTLIDFYIKEGYQEVKETTKITDEMYKKAIKKFQSDIKLTKEVEQQLEKEHKEQQKLTDKNQIPEKKDISLEEVNTKKEISQDEDKQVVGPKILGKIDVNQVYKKTKTEETKKQQQETKKETEKIKQTEESTKQEDQSTKIINKTQDITQNEKTTEPIEQPKETKQQKETIAEQTTEQSQKETSIEKETPIQNEKTHETTVEATIDTKEEDSEQKKPTVTQREDIKLEGPKILGKLDLEQANRSTRPEKKSKEEKELERKKQQEKKKFFSEKTISKKELEKNKQNQKTKRVEKVNLNENTKFEFKKKKKKFEKETSITSEQDIKKQLKETQKLIDQRKKSDASKYHREKREQLREKHERKRKEEELLGKQITVSEFITVKELASLIGVEATKIIEFCLDMGQPVNINFRLDADLIKMIAEEFGVDITFDQTSVEDEIEKILKNPENQVVERPPIVTVMGHVDHGKTSLLDYIRKTNVVSKESGGITQHIGAYSVEVQGKTITFIDTPGHEAFTSMRARGAKITDIAIIVIAADDKIMPQTEEAIDHAKAAGVSMIFAINKIDKNNADPERIKKELADRNLLIEQWGGKYGCIEISAKHGINIDQLLERILIEAELMELKANPNAKGIATVIEAKLDKGRGYVTNAIIRNGTLKIGDIIVSGSYYGRIKALFNDREERIKQAGPSMPVVILGLNGAPEPGEPIIQMDSEREASERAKQREEIMREIEKRARKNQTLQDISKILSAGQTATINFIVKADVKGSCDAISTQISKLSTPEVTVNIIRAAVGEISESDVLLATASNAIIIGFNVRPSVQARNTAESKNIEIRLYSIIFDIVNDVKAAISGMMGPEIKEEYVGTAEVLNTFKIDKVGTVAGCVVRDGKIVRDSKVHIIRDGIVVYTGKLNSLKRYKDDVREVTKGMDCGMSIENFNDIKIGDFIEAFKEFEVERQI